MSWNCDKKELHQYVHKVEYKLGRLIAIDLKFREKINLKIINIYVNSNDTEKIERDNLLKELNKLITEANVSKSHLIIMGDFNADAEKYDALNKTVTKGKYKIIQLLRDQGLYDTQKLTNINLQYTWKKNNETKCRIDYIWINDYMIEDLLITKVISCDELNTDHNILAMTINSSNIFGRRTISTEKKKKIKRDIYTIDKMTDELWAKFRTRLDELADKYCGFDNIFMVPNKNQNWVNNTWDKLENILKTTMDEIIPIKSIVKSDQPRRPKLKSETFKTYKWCLRIIRSINRDELENMTIGKKHKFIDNLQYIIQKYKWNSISVYNITNGLFSNNKDVLLSQLKELSQLIKTKLDVEDRQFIIDQIKNSINKRLERLNTHKKLMLNSILEREHRRINIDRIIVKNSNNEEELLLEETDILRETAKHFKILQIISLNGMKN